MGLTTYFYRGYNPFTKYHGHPSSARPFTPHITQKSPHTMERRSPQGHQKSPHTNGHLNGNTDIHHPVPCRNILGRSSQKGKRNGHPTFNRNPYNGYINPYYWVDDHPLLYGNHWSLDPGTHKKNHHCNNSQHQVLQYVTFLIPKGWRSCLQPLKGVT